MQALISFGTDNSYDLNEGQWAVVNILISKSISIAENSSEFFYVYS